MEQSIYEHPKLPTVKPRVTEEKPRMKKPPTTEYTQQPAHTSTNPIDHSDILKIKPIYNCRYPTRASKKLHIPQRYPMQLRTQSLIPNSVLNHLMAAELYTDLHVYRVLHQ